MKIHKVKMVRKIQIQELVSQNLSEKGLKRLRRQIMTRHQIKVKVHMKNDRVGLNFFMFINFW